MKLTNWQTFWKNVALDVPTVWIFLTRNLRYKKRFERDVLVTAFSILLMVIFGLFNINNEPCIDFRPWKVGNQMVDLDESLQVKSPRERNPLIEHLPERPIRREPPVMPV